MNYYSNYTREYVQDICDAINELDEDNNKPLSPDDFRSLTNFLQLFVLKSYERFTFLNSKGLVNRGRFPYTGVPIENTSYKWTYMKSRSIYVSREGLKIMKREDDEDFSRVMGHPPSKAQSGGCYIATTCYGDEYASEVLALKKYRDTILAKRWYGKLFIYTYYLFSPSVAKRLKNKTSINSFIKRVILNPIVRKIDNW